MFDLTILASLKKVCSILLFDPRIWALMTRLPPNGHWLCHSGKSVVKVGVKSTMIPFADPLNPPSPHFPPPTSPGRSVSWSVPTLQAAWGLFAGSLRTRQRCMDFFGPWLRRPPCMGLWWLSSSLGDLLQHFAALSAGQNPLQPSYLYVTLLWAGVTQIVQTAAEFCSVFFGCSNRVTFLSVVSFP